MNKIKLRFCSPIFIVTFFFLCSFPANSQDITGIWLTEKSESKIEIYEDNGIFFGKVLWIKEQTEKVQKRVGMTILKNFVHLKDGSYKGTVFAPHLDKTFNAVITVKNENEIVLRGYVGISLFGQSQTWERMKINKNQE
ncbi:MAG: DUF2147 domain-containing protein [Bacteroidales bacterium]|jgi:uncharacterized protein (DUF2147 family)|nr:DUF2147 domain-containing protein [Bacteroidales bacterium]